MYVPHVHLKRHISEEQLEELKKEINKTEYEKAREPLLKEIAELKKNNFFLIRQAECYRSLIKEIIGSIKVDYIEIAHIKETTCCEFYTSKVEPTEAKIEKITIPIKEELLNSINRRMQEIMEEWGTN